LCGSFWRLWATGRGIAEDTRDGMKKMSDISELVNRLRERSGQYDEYGWHSEIEIEAADALEVQAKEIAELKDQLRLISNDCWIATARIAKLKETLKPFAYDVAKCFQDNEDIEIPVKIRDIRAARAALKGEK